MNKLFHAIILLALLALPATAQRSQHATHYSSTNYTWQTTVAAALASLGGANSNAVNILATNAARGVAGTSVALTNNETRSLNLLGTSNFINGVLSFGPFGGRIKANLGYFDFYGATGGNTFSQAEGDGMGHVIAADFTARGAGGFYGNAAGLTNVPINSERPIGRSSSALSKYTVTRKLMTNDATHFFMVSPSVVYQRDKIALYWGAYTNALIGSVNRGSIHAAFGTSLDNLTQHGIVLAPGGPGAWDGKLVSSPRVYYENGTNFMYYVGGNAAGGTFEERPTFLGMAHSIDGTNWTKDPLPHIVTNAANTYKNVGIGPGMVIKKDVTYYMFYSPIGSTGPTRENVFLATSRSLFGPWVDVQDTPVVLGQAGFSARIATDCTVFKMGSGGYGMVFYQEHPTETFNYQLSSSQSDDLLSWTAPTVVSWTTNVGGMNTNSPLGAWVFEDDGPALTVSDQSGVYLLRPQVVGVVAGTVGGMGGFSGTFTGNGAGLTNIAVPDVQDLINPPRVGPGIGFDAWDLLGGFGQDNGFIFCRTNFQGIIRSFAIQLSDAGTPGVQPGYSSRNHVNLRVYCDMGTATNVAGIAPFKTIDVPLGTLCNDVFRWPSNNFSPYNNHRATRYLDVADGTNDLTGLLYLHLRFKLPMYATNGIAIQLINTITGEPFTNGYYSQAYEAGTLPPNLSQFRLHIKSTNGVAPSGTNNLFSVSSGLGFVVGVTETWGSFSGSPAIDISGYGEIPLVFTNNASGARWHSSGGDDFYQNSRGFTNAREGNGFDIGTPHWNWDGPSYDTYCLQESYRWFTEDAFRFDAGFTVTKAGTAPDLQFYDSVIFYRKP